jgi:hypothetical protein
METRCIPGQRDSASDKEDYRQSDKEMYVFPCISNNYALIFQPHLSLGIAEQCKWSAELSPLRLRLGGTLEDLVVYDVGNPPVPCLPFVRAPSSAFGFQGGCLSMARWSALMKFFQRTGCAFFCYWPTSIPVSFCCYLCLTMSLSVAAVGFLACLSMSNPMLKKKYKELHLRVPIILLLTYINHCFLFYVCCYVFLTIVTFVVAVCFIVCPSIANPTMKQKNKELHLRCGFLLGQGIHLKWGN